MTYEVYAIKYAHHARRAAENFIGGPIGGDAHDGPMPLDYFVWLVRGEGREIVVDTGFSAAMAAKRGRQHLRCPTEGLKLLGTDSKAVKDVVITHLHYDHVGNFELFPAATLHLQELEMRYATGAYMCHECFRGAFEVEDVVGMVRRVYENRVRFHSGDAGLFPGVSVHLIGGHTMGLQVVRVKTRRGWVVLEPLLRQHGAGAPLPDRLVGRRHGRGLSQAARPRRICRAHHPWARPARPRTV